MSEDTEEATETTTKQLKSKLTVTPAKDMSLSTNNECVKTTAMKQKNKKANKLKACEMHVWSMNR